ncbi:Transcriptional regulator, contains XRE-family HTH domain [Maridesulfovibrio ferrireducens]|uniref:Transcriptional regulator, contains XRE-family HTH domain n=1 Tax=Maridesulfovibrio ferrireducens TaxID=246191 RepID=A0A1G9L6R2_9BACT|nr:helix-turn-helix transcriptional regulator [Maridesulfovibrio ferrireducens]SDL57255.1 Transcriptional regulator, contains XRE-family HTH domain [Maridesulfovibrio ferrireducens]
MGELSAKEIGQRLKAFRLGSEYSAEDIAAKIGISRAALYRYEKGDPPKLETLESIAELLGVSLTSLMGVGVEYVPSAVSFFERMRQAESVSEHLFVMFGPVSYLLTTDEFDDVLAAVLKEDLSSGIPDLRQATRSVDEILTILKERKKAYHERKPSVVSLVSASELERFLRNGFIGRYDLPANVLKERKEIARREVENVLDMLEKQPIGVQIGILRDSIPSTSFQIFRQPERSVLAISPFRLGEFPNVRLGVAMITSAPEALVLHEKMVNELWDRSLKGLEAARFLRKLIQETGS